MRDQQLDDRVDRAPTESMTGRNTPTRPTRLLSRSTRPRATEDLPDRPSGEAMYTLRDMGKANRVGAQPPAGSLEPFAGLRIHRLLTSGDRSSIFGI